MKGLYLLSGLGADKRVFDFLDLKGHRVNHIQWVDPLNDESIDAYAKRILSQIKTDKPVLIGVSFGGMIAVEIAKLIQTEKIILISSAQTADDIPFYYKIVGKLKFHRLIPIWLLKSVSPITFWFFGVTTHAEKVLLTSIIKETDTQYLRWAIEKIVTWKNKVKHLNVAAIHGTCDRLLPCKNADHELKDGGHLMIVNRSEHISEIIRNILND